MTDRFDEIEHLWCKVCENDVVVAILDGELKLACECAIETDRIEPNDPDSLFVPVMPHGWRFVDEHDEDSQ